MQLMIAFNRFQEPRKVQALFRATARPGTLVAHAACLPALSANRESTVPDHSGAEGVDIDGNVYGAVVRRQMLERRVRK